MADEDKREKMIEQVFAVMPKYLNEQQRRILAGCLAKGYGHGGIKLVSDISHMDVRTIRSGILEIETGVQSESGHMRNSGGGRKPLKEIEPALLSSIEAIIEESADGGKEKMISWTNLSLRDISSLLEEKFRITAGKDVVSRALEELGYSRQANQKMMREGKTRRDRDAQFEYINTKSKEFIDAGLPVISADTRKKELFGEFEDNGQGYRKAKNSGRTFCSDFPLPKLGKAAPYAVYPVSQNTGYVNLGTDHDTIALAAESIRRWWNIVGRPSFPDAQKLYINCDGEDCSGWGFQLWKYELALFAQETGLEIHVSHLPPSGTSKWNRVEHRLFCFTTKTWEGKRFIDINSIVSLISSPGADRELRVVCADDTGKYQTELKDDDDRVCSIDMETAGPNKSWNYIIRGFKR